MASITVDINTYTNVHFAYFAKPKAVASGVNQLKESLQIGDIEINSYGDRKMEDSHFRRIKNILKNPRIEAKMTLPVSVFSSFEFDNFIYLKHSNLEGYFFVEKIDNYKDSATPVKVYLLYID